MLIEQHTEPFAGGTCIISCTSVFHTSGMLCARHFDPVGHSKLTEKSHHLFHLRFAPDRRTTTSARPPPLQLQNLPAPPGAWEDVAADAATAAAAAAAAAAASGARGPEGGSPEETLSGGGARPRRSSARSVRLGGPVNEPEKFSPVT